MEQTNTLTTTENKVGLFSNFSIGGANFTIAHIVMEVLLIGGLSYYYNKKITSLNTIVDDLQKKVSQLENKIKNTDCDDTKVNECFETITDLEMKTKKHMTNIYQMMRKLSENIQTLNYKLEDMKHQQQPEEIIEEKPVLKQRKVRQDIPPEIEYKLPVVFPQISSQSPKVVREEPIYVQPTKEVIIDENELDKELEEQGIFLNDESSNNSLQDTLPPQQNTPQNTPQTPPSTPPLIPSTPSQEIKEIIQPYNPPEKKKKVKKEKQQVE